MGIRLYVRLAVFERDDYRCRYCGVRYIDTVTGEPVTREPYVGFSRRTRWVGLLHLDHVIPRCKGGTDDIENLVTACSKCNLRKYDQVWEPRPLPSVASA